MSSPTQAPPSAPPRTPFSPAQPRPGPTLSPPDPPQPCSPACPWACGRFWMCSAASLPIFKRQMEFFFCSILITKMFNFPTFVFPGNVLKTGTFRPDHCAGLFPLLLQSAWCEAEGARCRVPALLRPPQGHLQPERVPGNLWRSTPGRTHMPRCGHEPCHRHAWPSGGCQAGNQ